VFGVIVDFNFSVKNFRLVLLNLGSLALNYVITYNGYVVILRGFRETQCTTMLMISFNSLAVSVVSSTHTFIVDTWRFRSHQW